MGPWNGPFQETASRNLKMAHRTPRPAQPAKCQVDPKINLYPNPATSADREFTISGYEGVETTLEPHIVETMNISRKVCVR